MHVEVSTQAELDAALKIGQWPICVGDGYFEVTARENSTVTARENSTVTAWGNSTVTARENSTVTAWENSTVTAWGNSTVTAWENSTVTAWGNSTVTARENSTVTAWENSTVTARGNSTVTASKYVAVHHLDPSASVTGGVVIVAPPITTAEEWCEFYGVAVTDSVALLYKGVNDDYTSPRGQSYTPGTIPIASDWDGGERECGGGLHFSPSPGHTLSYHSGAKRFLACPVALADIAVHRDAEYPDKVKARGCCAPVYEVDSAGRPVAAEKAAPQ